MFLISPTNEQNAASIGSDAALFIVIPPACRPVSPSHLIVVIHTANQYN